MRIIWFCVLFTIGFPFVVLGALFELAQGAFTIGKEHTSALLDKLMEENE